MSGILTLNFYEDSILKYSYEEEYPLDSVERQIISLSWSQTQIGGYRSLSASILDNADSIDIFKGHDVELLLNGVVYFSGKVSNVTRKQSEVVTDNQDTVSISCIGLWGSVGGLEYTLADDEASKGKVSTDPVTLLTDVFDGAEYVDKYQPNPLPVTTYTDITFNTNNVDISSDAISISAIKQPVSGVVRQVRDLSNGKVDYDTEEEIFYWIDSDKAFHMKARLDNTSPLRIFDLELPILDTSTNTLDIVEFSDNPVEGGIVNQVVYKDDILSLTTASEETARLASVAKYEPKRFEIDFGSATLSDADIQRVYDGVGKWLLEPLSRYTVRLNVLKYGISPPRFDDLNGYVQINQDDVIFISEPLMDVNYSLTDSGIETRLTLGRIRPSLNIRFEAAVGGDTDPPTVNLLRREPSAFNKTYTKIKDPAYIACTARDDTEVSEVKFWLGKFDGGIEGSVTSSGNDYIIDTVNLGSGDYVGYEIYISNGVGFGQRFDITAHDTGTKKVTVTPTWDAIPTAGATYEITKWVNPHDATEDYYFIGNGTEHSAPDGNSESFWEFNDEITGIVDSVPSVTEIVDAALTQDDDYWNGYIIEMTSGLESGSKRVILDFTASTDIITTDEWGDTIAAGDTYRIYPSNGYFNLKTQGGLVSGDIFRIRATVKDPAGNTGEDIDEFQLDMEAPLVALSVETENAASNAKPELVRITDTKFKLRVKTEDVTVKTINVTYNNTTYSTIEDTLTEITADDEHYWETPLIVKPDIGEAKKALVEVINQFNIKTRDLLYVTGGEIDTTGPKVSVTNLYDGDVDNNSVEFETGDDIILRVAFKEEFTEVLAVLVIGSPKGTLTLTETSPGSGVYEKQTTTNGIFGSSPGTEELYAQISIKRTYYDETGGVEFTENETLTGEVTIAKRVSVALRTDMPTAKSQVNDVWNDGFDDLDAQLRVNDTTGELEYTDGKPIGSPTYVTIGAVQSGTSATTYTLNIGQAADPYITLVFDTSNTDSPRRVGRIRYDAGVSQKFEISVDDGDSWVDLTTGTSSQIDRIVSSLQHVLAINGLTGDLEYIVNAVVVFTLEADGNIVTMGEIAPDTDDAVGNTLGSETKRYKNAFLSDSLITKNIIGSTAGNPATFDADWYIEWDISEGEAFPYNIAFGFQDD